MEGTGDNGDRQPPRRGPGRPRKRPAEDPGQSSEQPPPLSEEEAAAAAEDDAKVAGECTECGKQFFSKKALFGHMRCHPERKWRGINPPTEVQRLSRTTDAEREVADSLILLSEANNEDETNPTHEGPPPPQPPHALLPLLSPPQLPLQPLLPLSILPPPQPLEPVLLPLSILPPPQPLQPVLLPLSISPPPQPQQPVLLPLSISPPPPPPQPVLLPLSISPPQQPPQPVLLPLSISPPQQPLPPPQQPLPPPQQPPVEASLPPPAAPLPLSIEAPNSPPEVASEARGFECSVCKRVFDSHQALGGHRASHKNIKGCYAAGKVEEIHYHQNEEATIKEGKKKEDIVAPASPATPAAAPATSAASSSSATPALRSAELAPRVHQRYDQRPGGGGGIRGSEMVVFTREYKCCVCAKVFPTGQALGGHMRWHLERNQFIGYGSSSSASSSSTAAAVASSSARGRSSSHIYAGQIRSWLPPGGRVSARRVRPRHSSTTTPAARSGQPQLGPLGFPFGREEPRPLGFRPPPAQPGFPNNGPFPGGPIRPWGGMGRGSDMMHGIGSPPSSASPPTGGLFSTASDHHHQVRSWLQGIGQTYNPFSTAPHNRSPGSFSPPPPPVPPSPPPHQIRWPPVRGDLQFQPMQGQPGPFGNANHQSHVMDHQRIRAWISETTGDRYVLTTPAFPGHGGGGGGGVGHARPRFRREENPNPTNNQGFGENWKLEGANKKQKRADMGSSSNASNTGGEQSDGGQRGWRIGRSQQPSPQPPQSQHGVITFSANQARAQTQAHASNSIVPDQAQRQAAAATASGQGENSGSTTESPSSSDLDLNLRLGRS